jgi:hypothetical protein
MARELQETKVARGLEVKAQNEADEKARLGKLLFK